MRGKNYGDQNGKNPTASEGAKTRRSARRASEHAGGADWGNADPGLIAAAIMSVTRDGSAIRFGYTRDLGAFAVGFYENGVSETEYISPNDDIDTFLRGVIDDYQK